MNEHRGALEDNPVLDVAGKHLLSDARLHVPGRVPDFQPSGMSRYAYMFVSIDCGCFGNPRSQQVVCCHIFFSLNCRAVK